MQINKITVIGAGSMGHQIALLAALGGYETILQDINQSALTAAEKNINQLLDSYEAKGKIDANSKSKALNNLLYIGNLEESVEDVDLIIEAIIEKVEIKQDLFRQLDQFAKESTIFATNSSTIVNSKLAVVTNRPDKCVNMHFFYPPLVMDCIEVVMSEQTSQQTADAILGVCEKMGKKGFLLRKEIVGFVANRLLTALSVEAMRLYEQGVADFKDIDAICKTALNHPMGPFEITDFSGGDVILFVLQQFYSETQDEQFKPPVFLEEQIKAGKLGRKTGEGFYQYT
ncbi:3-hydroxyacyl-CoA dehydrogenase family protein [Lysinibacillus xylanilyticus]|uniref:3-hydroxyacyl-CoA dehydrogenase family protein n=1 Tax=Lysinibacillus xylanilyticus TaxID=582475 RepID=UPI003CFDEF45